MIKTPHLLTAEGERMLKNKHAAHSAPLLTLASRSSFTLWHSHGTVELLLEAHSVHIYIKSLTL